MSRMILLMAVMAITLTSTAGKTDFTINGIITNRLADSVTFSYYEYKEHWLEGEGHVISRALDKNGNFNALLPLTHNYILIQIQNGGQSTEIYANPGDKITMSVDAADFDASLKYKGSGNSAAVANFMAKHTLENGLTEAFQVEMQQLTIKEPAEFEKAVDARVGKELDFLIRNNKGLPRSFIKFWNDFHEYQKYETMLLYAEMHEIMKTNRYDIEVPKENYEVTKKVPKKFDDKCLYIDIYRIYLYRYHWEQLSAMGVKYEAGVKGKEYIKFDKMLELVQKEMPPQSAEYTFARYFYYGLKGMSLPRAEYLLKEFKSKYPNSDYTRAIASEIDIKRKLALGAPALDFTVTDADGKTIKLSELKGKVVYIDFWASWCSPCIAQFKHTKKIKEHFAGKDVVFVYVSIDEDNEAWLKAKEKYELTGLHTRIDGWKGKLAADYGVKSVPSYFLVDRNGKFAVENAPRPSNSEKLIEAIEALL